jgi:hypothetical protein
MADAEIEHKAEEWGYRKLWLSILGPIKFMHLLKRKETTMAKKKKKKKDKGKKKGKGKK